ncbi:Oxygen tolerance [Dyella jiangningensis]|uniref:BatD family protein n=1 Tax=Dyella sp. AtDHG13 TaxID=1938897 RepID=UPI000890EEBD|nr:BatD family protein [Dyella sp. AtDHG13]PXV59649.1 oxygen tolerance protein BatD [Dyella sp. AtDHG13]SDJ28570.1 Oxygen tolerance [Dyella jiangningensis]
MKLRALIFLWCGLACLWPLASLAADVQATLDRNRVELGETVTLNLRANGSGMAAAPDLSALSHDFAVLGSSSNTSVSIINGQRSAQVTVGVALRPLHTGTLRIPALSFAGGTTAPLDLDVTQADNGAAAAGQKDVFLEATVDPAKAYVGQQLVYTVRLFFATDLTSGSLEDPQVTGVDFRRLGGEINYQAERGGRRYNVIERRYAATPQREGRVQIPSVAFQGESVNMANPDAFFGNGTPVSAASPAVDIDVSPAPAQAAKGAWLPARALTLTLDGGPAHGDLHVGEPLNLVMNLQATGLPYEALPALSLPALQGATVYPDKPVNGTKVDGQWLVGQRQQSFAVVPNRAGTLTIPETTLTWWNVAENHAETARIPAHTYTVLPGAGAPASSAPSVPQANAAPDAAAAVQPSASVVEGGWWRTLALISFGLWLLSLLAWFLWRRRAKPASVVPSTNDAKGSAARLRAAFLAQARGSDAAAQARALLDWARAERPSLQNLGELAAALSATQQREAIEALQRKRYAGADEPGLGDRLAAAFKDGFVWQSPPEATDASPLPPLYPFKLR